MPIFKILEDATSGVPCTHSVFALSGYGSYHGNPIELLLNNEWHCVILPRWEALVRFTLKDLRERNCQYSVEEEDEDPWFANGIKAIPPFVTAALMYANSTDANDLFVVTVSAIKEVLEMEAELHLHRQLCYHSCCRLSLLSRNDES